MNENDQLNAEDEGLEEGFAGDAPAKPEAAPPVTAKHEDQPTAAGAEEQEPAQQPAPTDPQPKARDPLSEIDKISQRMRNFEGHIGGLKDQISKLTPQQAATATATATAAAKDAGVEAPTNTQISAALKDGAKFKRLVEDFPEWGDALAEAQEITANTLKASILADMPKTAQFDPSAINETLVTIAHRTWRTDTATPEFAEWLTKEPQDVQALADSVNPEDAITLMDKFYARPKATQRTQSNQSRLEAAVTPSSGGIRPPPKVLNEDDAMELGFRS